MRQMLALAMAMSINPTVLLLDEPTSGLDLTEVPKVDRRLTDLRSRGLSVLLVEHRIQDMLTYADRVLFLRDGRLNPS